jgi:tRNA U34 5-methylaminomethyl-2-thiouridine-forming methyltransferase MnmC
MEREIRITQDGSSTLYVKGMDECYHSIHGALQESLHVFINEGLRKTDLNHIRILETGFGTGLNALLSLAVSITEKKKIYYHTVEKYPLTPEEYQRINYETLLQELPGGILNKIHEAEWERSNGIHPGFHLYKEQADFRSMEPPGLFDLVYFDAFDPAKQMYLWTREVFERVAEHTREGAILVTYSARGSVRRTLMACGFEVEKIPGPPGKREMIRATRR